MSSSIRNSSETTLQGETTSITTSVDHATKITEFPYPLNNTLPVSKVSATCNFADLPLWLQDNCYILRGYRRPTFCYMKCAKSLFYIHNESVGAITFICLGFTTYFYKLSHQPNVRLWDFFVFYMFLLGAMVCLGFSSIFHTLCCHSERVCANWNRCDYVGIVTLIVGSFYPMIYYGFYCHSTLQIIYLSMISIFGAATISVAVASRFRSPQYRWFRTGLFLAMGLSAIVPLVHAVVIYGIQLCFDVISLKWLLLMGALYVVGAVIYGASSGSTCALLRSNGSNGILA
ncbi:2319_t:CDS:2 [Funneliformis mosseae]|uniref:2319_t:CDS:1 n=1 Tax=Funneliformis mosseae TaxID=27381 RepID=A0A9N9AKT2_FUNMO|nr:2319_t:CDS:2 [Funneliformis mosseae]